LDKSELYVNPHQIEFAEATPDTVITMLSGKKIVVRESVEEIISAIVKYRKGLGTLFAGSEL
jgi:flagellar protein FlbD